MAELKVKVKGIIKCQDKYLLVKKWYDDNIVNPYQWEFVDEYVETGANPDDVVLEAVERATGLVVTIDRILYTWTYKIGEKNFLGITYLCRSDNDIIFLSDDYSESIWVDAGQFDDYIDNQALLADIKSHLKTDDNELKI